MSEQTFFISQVHGVLATDRVEDPFNSAIEIIQRWAEHKLRQDLPAAFSEDKTFTATGPGNVRFRSARSQDIWTTQLAHPDDYNRNWSVETTLLKNGETTLFGTNLLCRVPEDAPDPLASLPIFPRYIMTHIGLKADGRLLSPTYEPVDDEEKVAALHRFLLDPARQRPAIVVSLDNRSSYPEEAVVHPESIAQRLGPLAHVFLLMPAQSWSLSEKLGREWSVYNGAIRTYNPGFDPDEDELYRHPVAFAPFLRSLQNGERSYINKLLGTAAKSSVAGNVESRVPSFSSARQAVLQQLALDAPKQACSLDEAKDLEIQNLKEANAALTEVNENLIARVTRLESQLFGATQQVESLLSERSGLLVQLEKRRNPKAVACPKEDILTAWEREGCKLTRGLPGGYGEIQNWLEDNLSDRLVVLPRAISAAKKSAFENTTLAYHALLLLANEYRDMIVKGSPEARARYQARLRELHLDMSPTFSKTPRKPPDRYCARYGGERQVLDMHLKKGNSFDPRHTLRIYFFFDRTSERPVVGYMFSHLDNRLS